jgi:TonB family protein
MSTRGCTDSIVLPPRFVNGTVDVTFTPDALVMVAGDRRIEPDEDTRRAVGFAGVIELAASFEICSDADGAPSKVTLLRSSEHPAYDRTLEEGIRRWRFIPREVRGRYVPSCMQAQLTYRPWRD